jgi:hypothetical protein
MEYNPNKNLSKKEKSQSRERGSLLLCTVTVLWRLSVGLPSVLLREGAEVDAAEDMSEIPLGTDPARVKGS